MHMVKLHNEAEMLDNLRFVLNLMQFQMVQMKGITMRISSGTCLAQTNTWERTTYECRLANDFTFLPRPLIDAKWLNKLVIVDIDARMEGQSVERFFLEEGAQVLWKAGSVWKPSIDIASDDMRPVDEDRLSQIQRCADDDLFQGFTDLFELDAHDIIEHRGRRPKFYVYKEAKPRSLKGFGGCRFMEFDGNFCVHCGKLDNRKEPFYGKDCSARANVNGGRNPHVMEWASCITLKKWKRAMQTGEITMAAWG